MRVHTRTVWVKSAAALACAFVLFAQVALALHQAGLDEHQAGEQCEYCIAGTSLAAGVSGAALTVPPAHHIAPPTAVTVTADFFSSRFYDGRAPPRSILA